MGLFVWKEFYSVGIERIDIQHKQLVNVLGALFESIKSNQPLELVSPFLEELFEYSNYHFSTEEKYFDMFEYEESDEHKQEHQQFVEKVQSFKDRLSAGDLTVRMEIFNYLREWLGHHILDVDKKYVPCFKENGIK